MADDFGGARGNYHYTSPHLTNGQILVAAEAISIMSRCLYNMQDTFSQKNNDDLQSFGQS
jgi:hypothetical protein